MANSTEARTPRFLSAARRLQVEPASFGPQASPEKLQPRLAIVDPRRASAAVQEPAPLPAPGVSTPAAAPAPEAHRPAPAPEAHRPAPAPVAPPAPAPVAPPAPVAAPAPAAAPAPEPQPTPEMLERIANAVEALRLQSERLAASARSDALEIGFLVAHRILELELSTSPEPLFALVRSAIRRAGESRTIGVRLHPADLALIRDPVGETFASSLSVAEVKWIADPTLSRGDCVVEADFGTVDGRLSTRLAELRRAIGSDTGALP